jgi:hypothetical protein
MGEGTPRWVKVFGIIGVIVVVVFLVLLFAGGAEHGPGRHLPGDDSARGQAPAGHTAPWATYG